MEGAAEGAVEGAGGDGRGGGAMEGAAFAMSIEGAAKGAIGHRGEQRAQRRRARVGGGSDDFPQPRHVLEQPWPVAAHVVWVSHLDRSTRCTQRPSEAIRGHQKPSEAYQKPSEAIRSRQEPFKEFLP